MINLSLSFALPKPWKDSRFDVDRVGAINFLVGPNGSGKSRFAKVLKGELPKARLLGTDRLSGMEQADPLRGYTGDHLGEGYDKKRFDQYKEFGAKGSGIDTIVLLEERMDLRIQLEATLSKLFDRRISLEWDSGKLVPRAVIGGTAESYRLDREECHGIKELLILLTHLYNPDNPYLIIDEPELHLHPQYQAFFLQEVRKNAGNPADGNGKKIVFLVTHSPFILDLRTTDDLQAVISFDRNFSIPRRVESKDEGRLAKLRPLLSRINVHHKQLFFSDHPVFVEGLLDHQIVTAMQEARGASMAAAGSCVIEAGGAEEANQYLELCAAFGKRAHFLYDLDSLFSGNLRSCIKDDAEVQGFLLTAGVGNDFAKYCGQLDRALTAVIEALEACGEVPPSLTTLTAYLKKLGVRAAWKKGEWGKARTAVTIAIRRYREDIVKVASSATVENVEGRLNNVTGALCIKNVRLLSGGVLEHHLPSYSGDEYDIRDTAKQHAVAEELQYLAELGNVDELHGRYGDLYDAVLSLPSKLHVDAVPTLREYLSDFIHELQKSVAGNPSWTLEQIQAHLVSKQPAAVRVFSIETFKRLKAGFSARISIQPMLDSGGRYVTVSHSTNAGMGQCEVEEEDVGATTGAGIAAIG